MDTIIEGAVDDPSGSMKIRILLLVCTVLAGSVRGTLQQSPQPALPDVQKLGPQVGSQVPDFTLLDQNGRSRTLMSVMGSKGVMLVFFRSADW